MAGRPTKYKNEYNEQAYKLCLLGATDKELSDFFEISESTLNLWKKLHKEFSESVKAGKIISDATIASKLYQRAMGYRYDEVHYEKVNVDVDKVEETNNDDMKIEVYKKKLITKEVAPDTTAAIFWLKNRQKEKWRDKQEIDHTTKGESLGTVPMVVIQNPHASD